jgi:two-component sensor histidine kinase
MEIRKTKPRLTLNFSSTAGNVEKAVEEIHSFLDAHSEINYISKQNIFVISEELIQNAHIHGNLEDTEKTIFYSLDLGGGDEFTVSVEDEGNGYTPEKLGKNLPHDPKQISKKGLILVKTLAKDISFEKAGKKIVVKVSLEDSIEKLIQRSE